jgi:nucleoside-diphosphate-sugar epimerase
VVQILLLLATVSQSRDMLWLDDAVDANIFCMDRPWDFHGEFYDCGTGDNITLNDLKDLIKSIIRTLNLIM